MIRHQLNIPPRRMWGWSGNVDGYCGETSVQSMGLYYGNYVSQELVRYADGNSELLVGINDAKALKALKYSYKEWDFESARNPQEKAFKAWIKENLDQGVRSFDTSHPFPNCFNVKIFSHAYLVVVDVVVCCFSIQYPVTAGFYLKEQNGDADYGVCVCVCVCVCCVCMVSFRGGCFSHRSAWTFELRSQIILWSLLATLLIPKVRVCMCVGGWVGGWV
jgi:hypothetical protein